MGSHRVEVGWTHPETEEDYRVVCAVTLGTPDRGPDFACAGGYPGDPPEVEVLEVVEDRPGGQARPELVAVVEADFARIEERALEEAAEPEDDDARYEAMRDREVGWRRP